MADRVEAGFFSFTEVPAGAHAAYNEWHQFDHLPEQLAIPAVARGDRWVATPACVAARAADDGSLGAAQYLTLYLFTEPLAPGLEQFRAEARRLQALGRFFRHRRAVMTGAWRLVATAASPRVLVQPAVVPWRPATGVYVVVEEVAGDGAGDAWLRAVHTGGLPALLAVPGVAGAWTFARTPGLHHDSWDARPVRITVAWLDGDPVATAAAIAPLLRDRWDGAPVEPVLAGPYEAVVPGRWDWFGEGS